MGALENANVINAAASIVPVPAPPFLVDVQASRGFLAYVRLSAGQYQFTLEDPLAFKEAAIYVTVPANTRMFTGAQIVPGGLLRVSIFDADSGLPADPDAFSITVVAIVDGEGAGEQLPLAPVPPPAPSGDVSGPGVSTDNAIARWNGTAGDALQNSLVTISDLGAVAGALTYNGAELNGTANRTTLGTGAGNFATASGARTTAIGSLALSSLTTGADNTALGASAGLGLTTSTQNTAVGARALQAAANASANVVAIGYRAMQLATAADGDIAIGVLALTGLTTGTHNVAIGEQAAQGLSTGDENVAVGWFAGITLLAGSTRNTLIGAGAGASNIGDNNILLGALTDVYTPGANDSLNIGKAIWGKGLGGSPKVLIASSAVSLATQNAALEVVSDSGADTEILALTNSVIQTRVYSGTATPTFAALAGSLYVKVNNATSDLFINRSAGTGTTWAPMV